MTNTTAYATALKVIIAIINSAISCALFIPQPPANLEISSTVSANI